VLTTARVPGAQRTKRQERCQAGASSNDFLSFQQLDSEIEEQALLVVRMLSELASNGRQHDG
jgi:hypothetical protein